MECPRSSTRVVFNLSPGPGRKPVFDKEQAIQAALEEGVASFSLRSVADKLGIKPPALYRMFNSRDELQAAAMHKLAEHINTPAVATTWQDALRLFSSRSWDLFSRYPEAPTVIMTKPEAIIDALARFRGSLIGWFASIFRVGSRAHHSPWTLLVISPSPRLFRCGRSQQSTTPDKLRLTGTPHRLMTTMMSSA